MNSKAKYHKYIYWFDSATLNKDLKEKSIKGGISTTISQMIRFGLSLLSTFILARILLPSDFGLVGMVTAFTGFANIIQDMGLSMAVIQKEKITHKQVSNLFWINVMICLSIAGIFALLSPLIVALYRHDTRIYPIIFSYAAGIAIGGLSLQHNALMTRKMLFTRIAKANILAAILSVICGVAAALFGIGYWAIVVLNISAYIFNTCFLWILCNWRPSLPAKRQQINSFLKFGAGLSGSNIVNYFSKNSADIMIGAILGPAAVGFYSKAYQLLMLPINQLRSPLTLVALPALSALKNDPIRFISYYKKYIYILAFVSMPLVACLAIFSNELVLIMLGDQWIKSSHIFQILAFAAFILPVASSRGMILTATGQTKRLFLMVCLMASVSILGFYVGVHWGVIGVAISLVITTYLLLIPTFYFAFKNTPLKVSDFFIEISLPVIHTLIMGSLILLLKTILLSLLPPLVTFVILAPIGMLFYYFSWKVYSKGRNKLASIDDLKHIFFQKLKRKRTGANRMIPTFSQ